MRLLQPGTKDVHSTPTAAEASWARLGRKMLPSMCSCSLHVIVCAAAVWLAGSLLMQVLEQSLSICVGAGSGWGSLVQQGPSLKHRTLRDFSCVLVT